MPSDDFSARMERVLQKRAAGTITLHGAEQYEFHRPARGAAVPVTPQSQGAIRLYPLTMILALAIGAGAALAVSVARLRLDFMPADPAPTDIEFVKTLGLGLAVALVLRSILRMKSGGQAGMLLVGVVLMTLGQHNLHHWFPETMNRMFTPEYTAFMRAETPRNSVLYRGAYLELAPENRLAAATCPASGC